jgi:hypothetical protein
MWVVFTSREAPWEIMAVIMAALSIDDAPVRMAAQLFAAT